jgi:hypothetical protein
MKSNGILILFLIILLSLEIHAQSNYLDGYVLTSETDTIFGKIDNKNYHDNSQFCDFKGVGSETITRFYPDKIYGYRFTNGKYYISKNVEIDSKQVQLFMEYLIHGKLDIFLVQDEGNSNHYFASKDTLPLTELKYSENMVTVDGVEKLKVSKPYIGLLTYYTSDCPSIKNEIPNLNDPDQKKLIHFAEKYHNLTCTNEKCIIYEKKLPLKIKINIAGGSAVYFSNNPFDKDPGVVPNYGFNIQFQQSQISESVYLGIGFYRLPEYEGFVLKGFQIPISINYYKSKTGISPMIAYEFDLNGAFIIQALKLGLNYQMKNMSLFIMADLKTMAIIKPFASSLNLGISYNLR